MSNDSKGQFEFDTDPRSAPGPSPYADALRRIPAGRTATFAELARLAGRPKAARAAGRAVGQIPTEDRRPWHRVVRSDGALAPLAERATVQLERLRAEGARPRADESIHAWARRRRARFVGAWRDRSVHARDDARLAGLDPLRVEPLRDEEETVERGFHFAASARPGVPRSRTKQPAVEVARAPVRGEVARRPKRTVGRST
jgi:alkylated DNA nucleotide flippase Atl1